MIFGQTGMNKLHSYISESFISRLLTMKVKSKDRDYNEDFLTYNNFNEYYSENKERLIFGLSLFETKKAAWIALFRSYLIAQLPKYNDELTNFLNDCITNNFNKLIDDFKNEHKQIHAEVEKILSSKK